MNTPALLSSNDGVNSMPPLRTFAQAMLDRRIAMLQEAADKADQPRRSALLKAQPEEI